MRGKFRRTEDPLLLGDPMAFGFRIRFNLREEYRLDIGEETVELVAAQEGKTLCLCSGTRGTPINAQARVVLAGKPYGTSEEATAAAEHYRERLLAMATRRRLAVDLGDGFVRSALGPAGEAELEKQVGMPVRPDVHGAYVYELPPDNGKVAFYHFASESAVKMDRGIFLAGLRAALDDPTPFDARERLAAEILASAPFVVSFSAHFLTLMSGIEALIEPALRTRGFIAIVQEFQERIASLTKDVADEATRQSACSSLGWLGAESIGQAGRRLAGEVDGHVYLNLPAAKFFRHIYDLRSEILHAGATRDAETDLLAVANATSTFLADILRGRIERRTGRKGEIPQVIEAVAGYMDAQGGGVTQPIAYRFPERPKP